MTSVPTTPRIRHITRCLFASLGLCIPLYILTNFGRSLTFYLSEVGLVSTLIYAIVLSILTYRHHALIANGATTDLPPVLRLPAIIFAFLIAIVWLAGLLAVIAVTVLTGYVYLVLALSVGIPFSVFMVSQMSLFFAIGGMAAKERAAFRRGERGKSRNV